MTEKISTVDFQVPVVTCELCQENRAEYYCQDCQEEMCGQCKTVHLRSKVSRHHTVIVSVLGKTESETKTPMKCSKHSTEKIQMHCNNCEMPVCITCIADEIHKNHSFDKLETILERYNREMTQIISETKHQISELENSLQTIDDNVKEYNTISDKTVSEINKQRQQIKSQADNKADGLIDQVEKRKTQDLQLMAKKKDDVVMSITEQKEFLQNCEESLKCTHDYTKLQRQVKKSTKPNPPSITYINPPTFVGDDTPDLQDRFGKLIETKSNKMITSDKEPQKKDSRTRHSSLTTISTEIVDLSRINPRENIRCVSAVNDKEAWCGCKNFFAREHLLMLVDIHGQIKRRIQTDYFIWDIALTSEGELLVTQGGGTYINKYLPDGKRIKIGKTNPYKTYGLSLTSSGDILVCLFNTRNDNKVVRMTTSGHIKQTISKDKGQQPLFTNPQYVAENINGDIVVVDKVYPATILVVDVYPATIIVVDSKGELRYKYPDSVQSSHSIKGYYGIACDNTGCILVSDHDNHRIHQIDIDGRFIQFVLTQQHGIQYPMGLSIDNKGQLWVCNNNGRELTVFMYRSS